MKVKTFVSIILSAILGLSAAAVIAQEGTSMTGMQIPKGPDVITTVKAARAPVKTIKKELPSGKTPVRKETPEFRGESLFYQRCSLCHLGEWQKGGPAKPYGPALGSTLKDPAREPAVRAFIQSGTANMPGFANTFSPSELDDLIAYIKSIQAL